MKTSLAWFSPLAPQQSEIANYTALLRPDLERVFRVEYFTEGQSGLVLEGNQRRFDCAPGAVPPGIIPKVNLADVPVYHLGNDHESHLHSWVVSRTLPGIVVLHQPSLHNFVALVYKNRLGDRTGYLTLMYHCYGELGLEAARHAWEGEITSEFMAEHFPLTQLAVDRSLAVIVHSRQSALAAKKVTTNRVCHVPYPFHSNKNHGQARDDDPTRALIKRIVVFGFPTGSRGATEFLSAFGGMPEKTRFSVEIIGEVANRQTFEELIQRLRLNDLVTLRSDLSGDEVDAALERADLAVNLHWPSLEQGWKSQLRIWDHALPSLVAATEASEEVPLDTVEFVYYPHEQSDIQNCLRALLKEPLLFVTKGRNGKRELESNHSPTKYVDALQGIIGKVDELRVRRAGLGLAATVGRKLQSFCEQERTTFNRSTHYAHVIADLTS